MNCLKTAGRKDVTPNKNTSQKPKMSNKKWLKSLYYPFRQSLPCKEEIFLELKKLTFRIKCGEELYSNVMTSCAPRTLTIIWQS